MSKSFAQRICKRPESFAMSLVRFQQRNATQNVWSKRLLLEVTFLFGNKKTAKTFLFFKKQVTPENVLEVFSFGKTRNV